MKEETKEKKTTTKKTTTPKKTTPKKTTTKKTTTPKKTTTKKTTTTKKAPKKTVVKEVVKEELPKEEVVQVENKQEKKELIIVGVLLCVIFIVIAILLMVLAAKPKEVERVLVEQDPKQVAFKQDKLNVYLFYGDGCPHCEQLIEFLNTLPKKYNNYYDLYTFEVWYNQNNNKLMRNLLADLDKPDAGLPCIFIGDQVFNGYTEEIGQEIKKALKEEYLLAQRFDVYKQYKEKA